MQLQYSGAEMSEEFSAADLLFSDAENEWFDQSCSATPLPCLAGNGQVVARLMQLHELAEEAAASLLLSKPLDNAAALLHLWPSLLRLTAVGPTADSSSPFAAAASIVLAERAGAPALVPFTVTHPSTRQQTTHGGRPATFQFDLTGPADATQAAELQVFAQQVNLAIEQSSKEALEDTLSELSRLPSANAVSIVRSSIEGQQQPEALRNSLRSMLLRRSGSVSSSAVESLVSSPLRRSLQLP